MSILVCVSEILLKIEIPWYNNNTSISVDRDSHGSKQMATEGITNPPTFRLSADIISRHLRETVSALSSSTSIIALMRIKNTLFSPWSIPTFSLASP